jgi:hypothetical protein
MGWATAAAGAATAAGAVGPVNAKQRPRANTKRHPRTPHSPTPRPPLPSDFDEVLGPDPDVPSDELWWGVPDPEVYAKGTTHLNRFVGEGPLYVPLLFVTMLQGRLERGELPGRGGSCSLIRQYGTETLTENRRQIDEECEKGNVVTLRRFREMMATAEDWELDVMRKMAELHRLRTDVLIPTGDGQAISFWDLYKWVGESGGLGAVGGGNWVDEG